MIVRFLQFLLAFLVVRILWGLIRSLFSKPAGPRPAARPGSTEQRGEVVRCEGCDLHIPKERAVVRDGRTFCSDACAGSGGRA